MLEALIFCTDWCEACTDYTPCSYRLIQSQKSQTGYMFDKCYIIDADKNKDLCQFYHIDAVPTIVFRIRSQNIHSYTFEIPESRVIGELKKDLELKKKLENIFDYYEIFLESKKHK